MKRHPKELIDMKLFAGGVWRVVGVLPPRNSGGIMKMHPKELIDMKLFAGGVWWVVTQAAGQCDGGMEIVLMPEPASPRKRFVRYPRFEPPTHENRRQRDRSGEWFAIPRGTQQPVDIRCDCGHRDNQPAMWCVNEGECQQCGAPLRFDPATSTFRTCRSGGTPCDAQGCACDESCACKHDPADHCDGTVCRHCGSVDEYAEPGDDGKCTCWQCAGRA